MKKYSILLLSLLAAAACTKESTQDIAPELNSNIDVRAAFDEHSSRLTTEDGLAFSLEEGKEQIGVYIMNEGMNTLENVLYTAGTKDSEGWIPFTTEFGIQVQSTSKFMAYAPYNKTTITVTGSTEDGVTEQSVAGGNWNGMRIIDLPSEQTQPAAGVKTDLAKYYAIVAAPVTPVAREVLDSYSVNLKFSGVFALVRFGLNNYTDGEIKISKLVFSAGDTALTGYFNVDLTNENPSLANTGYAPTAVDGKTFDSVTVTLAEPATVAAQGMAEVYAVVNACSAAAPKLTVYATDAEGKNIRFEKVLSDKTFTRQKRAAIAVKLENPIYEGVEDPGYKETGTGCEIYNAAGLTWFAEQVNGGNNFSGKTVVLTDNIDLNNAEWTPIGSDEKKFSGTFNGNNKTISNLKISKGLENYKSNWHIGLFGYAQNAVIKDLTIHNATISGSVNVACLCGKPYASVDISGINITGHVELNGYSYVGAISGYGYNNIDNCTVQTDETSYIKATYIYAGGICGFRGEGNLSVTNCYSNIDVSALSYVGGISGICHYGNTIDHCTVEADITIIIKDADRPDESDKNGIGGIAGITVTDNTSLCTIKNCNFTGKLTTNYNINHDGIVGGDKNGNTAQTNLVLENNTATVTNMQ